MRTRHTTERRDRGQAFTLEGFIGAIIILTAVLFALQAVVLTPTTGGAVDRTAQAQMEQEVQDALMVAENEGNLSEIVRYWNTSEAEHPGFHNATNQVEDPVYFYNNSDFAAENDFGTVLDEHFVERRGNSYNVDLIAYNESGERNTVQLVRMGGGTSSSAVSASYTVTLYNGSELTSPIGEQTGTDLEEARSDDWPYPVPPGEGLEDSDVYNVVEVRVTVW